MNSHNEKYNDNSELPEKNSKLRELTDTSSVVAHDLCAQLHVLQFCLEELESFISPEGKEYLSKMNHSTRYISQLVDSFRKGLKVNLNDEKAYPFDEIYEGALELIKNHYFVILERVSFTMESTKNPKVKNQARTLLSILFGIYSVFLDELKANGDDSAQISFQLFVKEENSRFAKIKLKVGPVTIDSKKFIQALEKATPSKGKMRQFLGLNALKERMGEDDKLFKIESQNFFTEVELTVPLDCQ